jgi:hypothetical protein
MSILVRTVLTTVLSTAIMQLECAIGHRSIGVQGQHGRRRQARAAEKSLIIIIIAGLKRRIDTARATLEPSEKT